VIDGEKLTSSHGVVGLAVSAVAQRGGPNGAFNSKVMFKRIESNNFFKTNN